MTPPLRPEGPPTGSPRSVSTTAQSCAITLALWSFAVAQPVYFQLASHTAFLRDTGVVRSALWLVILVISLGAPLLACLPIVILAHFRPAWAAWGFRLLQAVLLGVLLLQVVRVWPLAAGLATTVAGSIGTVWLAERTLVARRLLLAATLGIVIFPAFFVAFSPASLLAVPQHVWRRPLAKGAEHPVPVVFIVFDEFSGTTLWTKDRQIDADLFPNFAELGRDSVWFRNATTVNGVTAVALPALLSGRYPPDDSPFGFQPSDSLFSILIDEQGYDGHVLEPVSRLCTSPNMDEGVTRGPTRWKEFVTTTGIAMVIQLVPFEAVDEYIQLPKLPVAWFGAQQRPVDLSVMRGIQRHPWDRDRDLQIQQFTQGLVPSERPSLHFLHVLIPHRPYAHDPLGQVYSYNAVNDFPAPESVTNAEYFRNYVPPNGNDPLWCAQMQLRYLWQVRYADLCIGKIRQKLIDSGMYERSLIVVMADHGVCHRPKEHPRYIRPANQLDIASIPLFVKLPGSRQRGVSDLPVESIDILPTVLDVLGISDGPSMDGCSVFAKPYRARPSKRVLFGNKLHVLPADYPQGLPREEFPLLSSEVEPTIRSLVGRDELVGRRVAEMGLGPPTEYQMVESPCSHPELLRVPNWSIKILGRFDRRLPGTPCRPWRWLSTV